MAITHHHVKKTKTSLGLIGLTALLLLLLAGIVKTAPANGMPTLSYRAEVTQSAKEIKLSDEASASLVILTDSGQPVANTKIGLLVADSDLRSPRYSLAGLYSLNGQEAFKTTNEAGKVDFTLKSQVAGEIKYQIILMETIDDKPVIKTLPEMVTVRFEP